MKNKKPDKSVAQMAVLKDIRGLLSVSRDQALPVALPKPDPTMESVKIGAGEQLKQYEELVRKQQAALDKLEADKQELESKLSLLESAIDKPAPAKADTDRLGLEISNLEARKAELTAALSQVEDLLQMKIKELARRIARVYEEAGDTGADRDFRRLTDQLESAENFGEFLRALLRE